MRKTLVFDMDGTLNHCSRYYREAVDRFVHKKAAITGVSPAFVKQVLEELDLSATALPDAFKRHRFPRSFMAASYAIDSLLERPLDVLEAEEAFRIGDSVFDVEYELFEGTLDVLQACIEDNWHLVLVTKGDWGVQWSKIHRNNLLEYFKANAVYVTPAKSAKYLQSVVKEQDIDINSSYVIGDSVKDDIAPGNAVGFETIQICTEGTWKYNEIPGVNADHKLDTISQLGTVIPTLLYAVR